MYKDEENFTAEEIADFFHCPLGVIYNRIKKYNISLRQPQKSNRQKRTYFQPKRWQDHLYDASIDATDIDRMYNNEGMNLSDIMRETGISYYALKKIFRYHNIPFTAYGNKDFFYGPERADVDYDQLPLYAKNMKEACNYLVMKNMMDEMNINPEEEWKKEQEEQFILKNSLPILIAEKMQNATVDNVIKYVQDIVVVAFPGADTPYKKFTTVQGLIMEAKKLLPTDDQYGGLTKEQFDAFKKDVTSKAFDDCKTEEENQKRFKKLMEKMGS